MWKLFRKSSKVVKMMASVVVIALLVVVLMIGYYGFVFWTDEREIYYNADAALESGDYERARSLFALIADGDGVGAAEAGLAFERAKDLMSSGDYDKALETLRHPYLRDLNIPELADMMEECGKGVILTAGRRLYMGGRYADALSTLETLERGPYFVEEAKELADDCRDALLETEIVPAINAGDYDRAEELLTTGYGPKLPGQEDLLEEIARRRTLEKDADDGQ